MLIIIMSKVKKYLWQGLTRMNTEWVTTWYTLPCQMTHPQYVLFNLCQSRPRITFQISLPCTFYNNNTEGSIVSNHTKEQKLPFPSVFWCSRVRRWQNCAFIKPMKMGLKRYSTYENICNLINETLYVKTHKGIADIRQRKITKGGEM